MKFFPEHNKRNKGMTYVELIVVLAIFSVLTSVVLFNYKKFQAKVDIKNLANDIALKFVEAQKSATSGKLNSGAGASWKPAYGVYFNLISNTKSFTYFADLNNDKLYTDSGCTGECVNTVSITKGNYISKLDVFYQNGSTTPVPNDLQITFTRPNYGATIRSVGTSLGANISYIQVTVYSADGTTQALVKLYTSGRIQIN